MLEQDRNIALCQFEQPSEDLCYLADIEIFTPPRAKLSNFSNKLLCSFIRSRQIVLLRQSALLLVLQGAGFEL